MHITRHCLLVLCSSALLASGLTAQRAESGERASQDAPTRNQREQAGREAEQTRESAAREAQNTRERAAQERGAATREAAGRLSAEQQRALAAEVAHQETTHRARMAKLKRLKELAEQARQADRVKQIEDLQRKEMQSHERKMAMFASRLDPEGRAAMERALGRGREPKARTQDERRRALEAWKKEHPGRSHGVRRGANTSRESGRPAGGNTDRATGGRAQQEPKTRDGGRDGGRDG